MEYATHIGWRTPSIFRDMTYKNPEWSYSAVLYELNVRQLTPEGTFAAAMERLPFLRSIGIDAIWLMPIYPIGIEGRKGSLGSYYSIRDYQGINEEFGTADDFRNFVGQNLVGSFQSSQFGSFGQHNSLRTSLCAGTHLF